MNENMQKFLKMDKYHADISKAENKLKAKPGDSAATADLSLLKRNWKMQRLLIKISNPCWPITINWAPITFHIKLIQMAG
jgi:hypothetical protein